MPYLNFYFLIRIAKHDQLEHNNNNAINIKSYWICINNTGKKTFALTNFHFA